MTQTSTESPWYKGFIAFIACGFLLWVAGFYLAPSSGAQDRIYYNCFVIPFLLLSFFKGKEFALDPRYRNQRWLLFMVFLLWLPVCWGNSDNQLDVARKEFKNLLMIYSILFGTAFLLYRPSSLLKHVQATIVSAAAIAAVLFFHGAWQTFHQGSGIGEGLNGYGNLGDNPNETGLAFAAALLVVMHKLPDLRGKKLAGALLFAFAILVALLLTMGRTGMLAVAAGTLASYARYLRARQVAVLFLSAGAVFLVSLAAFPEWYSYIIQAGLSRRPDVWQPRIEDFLNHPLFGIGLNGEHVRYIPELQKMLDSHNLYIDTALRSGIYGLLVLTGIIVFSVSRGITLPRKESLFLYLLVFGLVSQFFEGYYTLYDPNSFWLFIWLPIAMIAALSEKLAPRGAKAGL